MLDKIEKMDREIDEMVFELHRLGEEDVGVLKKTIKF